MSDGGGVCEILVAQVQYCISNLLSNYGAWPGGNGHVTLLHYTD